MIDALELLGEQKLVPVAVIHSAVDAVPLAETLLAAGVGAIEITLRTPEALKAIETVAAKVPDMIVGAGSIRRAEQLAEVFDAGAVFGVSPGSSESLLAAAKTSSLALIPGAATATEVMNLLDHGYRFQKFFPAELLGGTAMIKALSAPLPEVVFFPTGGISPENLESYLSLANVQCVGGSWFVPPDQVGNAELISQLTRDAMALIP